MKSPARKADKEKSTIQKSRILRRERPAPTPTKIIRVEGDYGTSESEPGKMVKGAGLERQKKKMRVLGVE